MKVDSVTFRGFRCFGPEPTVVRLSPGVTALVGANGAGKTALMQGLQRMFGITEEQRRLRRTDFHVPPTEAALPQQRTLSIDVILSFPELADGGDNAAVPAFFRHMAADADGTLRCRLRLDATWIDDGTADGAVEASLRAISTLRPDFREEDCRDVSPRDRGRIQLVYVPASRDGASQLTALLRGRLWRAIDWSAETRAALAEAGDALNQAFLQERAVTVVSNAVENRWQEVHGAGTFATPVLRPVGRRFEEVVGRVDVFFRPDEAGGERGLDSLSDGQRSLFHLAMVAATLDVEATLTADGGGFNVDDVALPVLTILAVEEPENCVAPYYLSRIVRQIHDISNARAAQALVSSHSASILARVRPEDVRHFRLESADRRALVNEIRLPPDEDEAGKFVREAVHAYPELYFARFVVLGEGSSEEIVLPRIAEAMGLDIDRSFAAMVPLGGRHVNHLWRLLSDLAIPHATLLDLDFGRAGGGWGRIRTACEQLLAVGGDPQRVLGVPAGQEQAMLDALVQNAADDRALMEQWIAHLRQFGVFFSAPLDLDMAMLHAFPAPYCMLEDGAMGPRGAAAKAKETVLGEEGDPLLYGQEHDDRFLWYRYLFLGRGKPTTHLRALGRIPAADLAAGAPEEIRALLQHVAANIVPVPAVAAE